MRPPMGPTMVPSDTPYDDRSTRSAAAAAAPAGEGPCGPPLPSPPPPPLGEMPGRSPASGGPVAAPPPPRLREGMAQGAKPPPCILRQGHRQSVPMSYTVLYCSDCITCCLVEKAPAGGVACKGSSDFRVSPRNMSSTRLTCTGQLSTPSSVMQPYTVRPPYDRGKAQGWPEMVLARM